MLTSTEEEERDGDPARGELPLLDALRHYPTHA